MRYIASHHIDRWMLSGDTLRLHYRDANNGNVNVLPDIHVWERMHVVLCHVYEDEHGAFGVLAGPEDTIDSALAKHLDNFFRAPLLCSARKNWREPKVNWAKEGF